MSYSNAADVISGLKNDVKSSILGLNEYIAAEEVDPLLMPLAVDAVADADAEIDGYLNKRYPVPLATVPGIIEKLSKDIAIYNLMSRNGIDAGESESNYLTRYNAAIKYLTMAAEGKVDIGLPTVASSAALAAPGSFSFHSNTPIFGRDKMNGM